MGPLNSLKQLELIEKNITETEAQGGKICFLVHIIECKNHNLPTAENELFGLLSVMKFENEEELINLMNEISMVYHLEFIQKI